MARNLKFGKSNGNVYKKVGKNVGNLKVVYKQVPGLNKNKKGLNIKSLKSKKWC